jgi:NADP-dependent 3-hydroxy acid dehydrogenase YdfG
MPDAVFIVTGASAGIGIETGRALVATRGSVFLTGGTIKGGVDLQAVLGVGDSGVVGDG